MQATKPWPLGFFLIMTMKTSSIILCIFFSIEPLTVNCAYFRKKVLFVWASQHRGKSGGSRFGGDFGKHLGGNFALFSS